MGAKGKITWPVTVGSRWRSKSVPTRVWELTMADVPRGLIGFSCGPFTWEGPIDRAALEFSAFRANEDKPGKRRMGSVKQ